MKLFKIFSVLVLCLLSVTAYSQFTSGSAFPIVERSTFSSDAPCGVCTPWQYVQSDSTLRRYIGVNWVTVADPNTVPGQGNSITFAYDTLTSGDLSIIVYRKGSSATTLTVNATGDYTVVIPTGTYIEEMFVHGSSNTLSSGSFILRLDGSADSREYTMISQLYNTSNGALVDVFAQGNNHTRAISSSIVSDTYPNMNPYSTTGFDIIYR